MMNDPRPNVLLIVTDSQRADALGIAGRPVLDTPYLDALAAEGARFERAYSPCPVCIPARRSLATGTEPAHHGVLMNYNTDLPFPTLAECLSDAGYHTHMSGKLHLHPPRKRYGFHSMDLCDRPRSLRTDVITDDYQRFLIENGVHSPNAGIMEGAHQNGWIARPFALPDRFHLSNWTVDRALRFLERRDPTAPFFLNVSFFHPHAPCCPPAYYFDKYMSMDLPEPAVGEWSKVFDTPQKGLAPNAWRTSLTSRAQKEFMAGYFGCIEHLDHQLGRLLQSIPDDTIILFVSDHGEMLGEHQWIRKRSGFEGSAKIPFILNVPDRFGFGKGVVKQDLVGLQDVMPTVLDLCDQPIPDTVDGHSVVPLLKDATADWRQVFHGECCRMETLNSGMQFLTDARWKYMYYPGPGDEQLFDLENDPKEMHDVAGDHPSETARCRSVLIDRLKDRPEGFVIDGQLVPLAGPTAESILELQ